MNAPTSPTLRGEILLALLCVAAFFLLLFKLAPSMAHTSLADYHDDIAHARECGDDELLRRASHQLAVLQGEASCDPDFTTENPNPTNTKNHGTPRQD